MCLFPLYVWVNLIKLFSLQFGDWQQSGRGRLQRSGSKRKRPFSWRSVHYLEHSNYCHHHYNEVHQYSYHHQFILLLHNCLYGLSSNILLIEFHGDAYYTLSLDVQQIQIFTCDIITWEILDSIVYKEYVTKKIDYYNAKYILFPSYRMFRLRRFKR